MKNCLLIVFILSLISLIEINCQLKKDKKIEDLIQPIRLIAGETDTILVSDLFFSDDYLLQFEPDSTLKIDYDSNANRIILTPASTHEGLSLLRFGLAGNIYHIPVYTSILQTYKFTYLPDHIPDRMNLFGSFNSWNRDNIPLTDENQDGVFEVTIALAPGRYEYKFWLDGKELIDPSNPAKVSNPFGDYNSVLNVPPRHIDQAYLHILKHEKVGDKIKFSFLYKRENERGIISHDNVIALLDNEKIPQKDIVISNNRIDITIDNSDLNGQHVLRAAVNQDGLATYFQTVHLFDGNLRGSDISPFEWNDAIMYSIMVDRFSDGDPDNTQPVQHPALADKANFYGGDLQGIIDKIEEGYFDKLGINVLWLSPINQNTFGAFKEYPEPHRYFAAYHGYWPIHHEQVDIRFGNMDLFKALVNIAHQNGIKVILDFVANHVHQEHPFFLNHPEWFGELELPDGRLNIRYWDEYRLTTWFDTFLPSFDYADSKEALEIMTDNAVWWLKTSGMDGFRHDAVKHIPNKFWRLMTRKVKQRIVGEEKREIYQIGETFGSYDLISSYVNNGQLDAQFNFNLYDAAIHVFLTPGESFSTLDTEIHKSFSVYGMNHLMGNVMDSHDKVRFMAYTDGDISLTSGDATEIGWTNPPEVNDPQSYKQAQLYLVYLMTTPGVPVIYYGDEIGMTGAADPDNRRPMKFGNQLNLYEQKMLQEVTEIVNIRKKYSPLRYGDFQTLLADESIYAYLRSDFNARILVFLNKGETDRNIELKLSDFYQIHIARNVMTGEILSIRDSRMEVEVPATGWRIFLLET